MRIYHARRRHVWRDMEGVVGDSYRERRLDEHICLQVSRVGVSHDDVGQRGVRYHGGRFRGQTLRSSRRNGLPPLER